MGEPSERRLFARRTGSAASSAGDLDPDGFIREEDNCNEAKPSQSDRHRCHRDAAVIGEVFRYAGYAGTTENPGFEALSDENGMVLTLFRFAKGKEMEYPPTFHIGFIQENEERVNEINKQLKDDGYEVPPPARMHGAWTFYFRSPGGFTIEFLA